MEERACFRSAGRPPTARALQVAYAWHAFLRAVRPAPVTAYDEPVESAEVLGG